MRIIRKIRQWNDHRPGETKHIWYVENEKAGVHLWIIEPKDGNPDRWYGGIELHSKTPFSEGEPPHRENCEFIGKCWHDGTSLGAEPYVASMRQGFLTDGDGFYAASKFLIQQTDKGEP